VVTTPIPQQGEVWWAEELDKRRPVLVVSRSAVIPVLSSVVVAPVSRTVRNIPTEVALGPAEGLPVACAASFDNLVTIPWRGVLTNRVGALGVHRHHDVCAALRAMSAC